MRILTAVAMLLAGVGIGWGLNLTARAGGDVGGYVDITPADQQVLQTGDDVRLYLNRAASGANDQEYVQGKLMGFVGESYKVAGKRITQMSRGHEVGNEDRQLIWLVPAQNIAYYEKATSVQFTPTTQP